MTLTLDMSTTHMPARLMGAIVAASTTAAGIDTTCVCGQH